MENLSKSEIKDLAKFAENGKITIEVLEGQAKKHLEPVVPLKEHSLVIKGSIGTIAAFIQARHQEYTPVNCQISIDLENNQMIFSGNECQADNTHMTRVGSLITHSKHFKDQEINTGNDFTPLELASFLRRRKNQFVDPEEFKAVWTALSTFEATIDTRLENVDHRDGNKRSLIKQDVAHNIPKTFDLMLPLFNNVDPIKIKVEIDVDPNGLRCSMMSFDLDEKYDELKKSLFDLELDEVFEDGIKVRDFCLVYYA